MKLRPTPYVWVSFAMIVGVMGTALISPLYALYKQAWQLQTSDISLIYVMYMGGALFGLLFLGRLPDRIVLPLVALTAVLWLCVLLLAPGTPASATVGTSGSKGRRLLLLTPNALTLPASIRGTASDELLNM